MLQLLNLKTIGIVLGALLTLGTVIWYYGRTEKQAGRQEVYDAISEGKYDQNFTYYLSDQLPQPKPIILKGKVVKDSTEQKKVDSLIAVVQNKDSLIRSLAEPYEVELVDSVHKRIDAETEFNFRAVHTLTAYPLEKLVRNKTTYDDLQIPVKYMEKVVLRDPTFWENAQKYGLGALIGGAIIYGLTR